MGGDPARRFSTAKQLRRSPGSVFFVPALADGIWIMVTVPGRDVGWIPVSYSEHWGMCRYHAITMEMGTWTLRYTAMACGMFFDHQVVGWRWGEGGCLEISWSW